MKANKFFLGLALIGAILTGCNNDQSVTGPTGEVSYMSVNLNYANQGTRAGETFEDGIEAENDIASVTFFFFDEKFAAYPIVVNNGNSFITCAPTSVTPETNVDHVEAVTNAMVVIEKSKQTPPSYILAVANCPSELQASLSLADLQSKIGTYNKNGENFIMANSVYVNGAGEEMYVTPITNANLAASSDEIKSENYQPIEIYVERTAAKVRVNNFAQNGTRVFSTGITTADGKEIHAEIIGWQVTDVNEKAYLLKKIDQKTWNSDTNFGLTWNDAFRYRSYWATSYDVAEARHPHTGSAIAQHNGEYDYYYENTTATVADRSQLIVVAAFKTKDDNATTYSDVTIAEWWGFKYTFDGLKTVIANSLASELYFKDGNTYKSITKDYIDFKQVENTATNDDGSKGRYWSRAVLATGEGLATDLYDATGKKLEASDVDAIFEAVRHAKIWKEELGGYYYLDIKHLGTAGSTTEFGLVRNHLYDYTIDVVKGLGTPIYNGGEYIIPEDPEGEETYISAKLNIQAWRVVSQNQVTLQ